MDRRNEPDLADWLSNELPGIFNWAFQGLRRLFDNSWRFTESERARANRELVRRESNNILEFLEAGDYISFGPDRKISSKECYEVYLTWCDDNASPPCKQRSFSEFIIANLQRYGLGYSTNLTSPAGRRVRGFTGIGSSLHKPLQAAKWREVSPEEDPEQLHIWK